VKNNHIPEEKIVDYVLGNLSRVEYFKINSHLKYCPKCYMDVRAWQKTLQLETSRQMPTPSSQQVYSSIRRKQHFKRRCLTVAFASLSLLLLIISLFSTQPSQDLANHSQMTREQPINDMPSISVINNNYNNISDVFLNKNIPSTNNQIIFSKNRNDISLKSNESYLQRYGTPTQIVIVNDEICSIDWGHMHMICMKYFQNHHGQIIPINTYEKYILNR